ncbi:MAG: hypothetical protein SVM80_07165 [Halobacteriota archaeon]|nr:hypothetical protein [Halobacteriota archaeon]
MEDGLKLIDEADLVILTDVPFGHGNIKNIEAARMASSKGPFLLIDEAPIDQRDFTDGIASKGIDEFKRGGAIATKLSEVLSVINRLGLGLD